MSGAEKTCLLVLLGVTALACVALAIPALVVIGLFLLIIPGLILGLSPLVAMYGWLFAVPYAAARRIGLGWWAAAPLALAGPILVGAGVPTLSNAVTNASLAIAIASDIRPARPLPIGGTVVLVRDEATGGWHQRDNSCDDLCLRLLYNRNARIVYAGQIGKPGQAFTIERRDVCPPFTYSGDSLKWNGWPDRAQQGGAMRFPSPPGLKEIVEARVAGGDCLVSFNGPIRPDWTIERVALSRDRFIGPWSLAPGKAEGERITVYHHRRGEMRPTGRFTNTHAQLLSIPLAPEFTGGFENMHWRWDRKTVGEGRWTWSSVAALRSLVAFNAELPEGTSPLRMRELLAAALADPRRERDDAGLLLANSVMVDIARNGARPGDAALLARAIGDDRFTKIEPRYEIAKMLGADYAVIGDSAVARLARLPSSDSGSFPHHALNSIIANMPETWFVSPPSSLTDILRDPVIAARADRIIGKLDAGGAAAVPLLTDIVTLGAERVAGIEDDSYARSNASEGINAAVAALCRIGPPGRRALAPIIAAKQRLTATSRRWRDPNPGKYSALWRGQKVNTGFVVTLVSMGVPISEFRAPDQPSSTINGSWQAVIISDVKRHNCTL